MHIEKNQLTDLQYLQEDIAEYFTDENMISGPGALQWDHRRHHPHSHQHHHHHYEHHRHHRCCIITTTIT